MPTQCDNTVTFTNDSSTQTNRMSADYLLCTALDLGEHLLRSGSDITRVEETIERVCKSCGAAHVEAFAINSLISASVRMPDGEYSKQIRHVKSTAMNLYRVEKINQISREICRGEISVEEAAQRLESVKHKNPYPVILMHIGNVFLVMGFTLFFGGSWLDTGVSGIIAFAASLIISVNAPFTQGMLKYAVGAFVSGLLASLSVKYGIGKDLDIILIGTIMQLIPGLAFGNAVNDMINGNLISGTMRFTQSIITAIIIALGYAAALMFFGGI